MYIYTNKSLININISHYVLHKDYVTLEKASQKLLNNRMHIDNKIISKIASNIHKRGKLG